MSRGEALVALVEAPLDAAAHSELRRLPELFCGFRRRPGAGPTPYPSACSPQAWAAAALPAALAAALGLEIEADPPRVRLRHPRLPAGLDWVRLWDLEVAGARLDILPRRSDRDVAVDVLDRTAPVEVQVIRCDGASGLRDGTRGRHGRRGGGLRAARAGGVPERFNGLVSKTGGGRPRSVRTPPLRHRQLPSLCLCRAPARRASGLSVRVLADPVLSGGVFPERDRPTGGRAGGGRRAERPTSSPNLPTVLEPRAARLRGERAASSGAQRVIT